MPNTYKVLIIDPEKETQALIQSTLIDSFKINQTDVADSIAKAGDLLSDSTNTYGCTLISSSLSDGSGLDCIAKFKSEFDASKTNILYMSESNDRNQILQAASCGATDFILKPMDQRNLLLKLRKLITGKQFRTTTRISTLGIFNLKLKFQNDISYEAKLEDISLGGCSVKSNLFTQGGCVFDKVELQLTHNEKPLFINAELARTERDPESVDKPTKQLIAGFQFSNIDDEMRKKLQAFIDDVAKTK